MRVKRDKFNEKIIPHQSCKKSLFYVLGIILIIWSLFFSILLISFGAWPISLFLGAEYLLLVFLLQYYFKEKNLNEKILIDANKITIEKIKNNQIFEKTSFDTYWSRAIFNRLKNKSKLIIKQSSKEREVGNFLHADLKEKLYLKIKKKLSNQV